MAKKSAAKASSKKSSSTSKPVKAVSTKKAISANPTAKPRVVKTRGEVRLDAIDAPAAKEFAPTRTRSLTMRPALEAVAIESRRIDEALAARLEQAAVKARKNLRSTPTC